MDVQLCLEELVGSQGSYNIQAQALYHFIVLLIVLILLFNILRERYAISYFDLTIG